MKTEFEKMRSQELYSFADPEVEASIVRAQGLCARLRSLTISDPEYRPLISELIPNIPETATICPPFHCDHGHGIVLDEDVFINYGGAMKGTIAGSTRVPDVENIVFKNVRNSEGVKMTIDDLAINSLVRNVRFE